MVKVVLYFCVGMSGQPDLVIEDAAALLQRYTELCKAFTESVGMDATMNLPQLVALFKSLKSEMEESEVERLWSQIDKDGSGDVSISEFLWYLFDFNPDRNFEDFKGLSSSSVYCRIRPIGVDGHTMGEEVEKQLDSWTEDGVSVKDRHERIDYTFPQKVLLPESSQEETYSTIMSNIFQAWMYNGLEVILLAYGQTGTGKTHTMFGPKESLSSDTPHPDWGLFPRVVHHCLEECHKWVQMTELFPKQVTCLRAFACEFYLGQAFDLVGEKAPLTFTPNGEALGRNFVEIRAVSDLVPFLDMVSLNRTMSATKMNAGSSRSHCALTLELAETGASNEDPTRWYFKRSLTILDMAGSERPSKTGAERMGSDEMAKLFMAPEKITQKQKQSCEGFMINSELSAFKSEIDKAIVQNRTRKKYVNNSFPGTPFIRMLGRSLVGEVWMNAVVCLSQSPQNGWETWFSCQYGDALAKLQAPLKKLKPEPIENAQKRAAKAAAKAKKAFDATPQRGSPASKYWASRKAMAKHTADELELIERFIAELER